MLKKKEDMAGQNGERDRDSKKKERNGKGMGKAEDNQIRCRH